jgi:hypothetical protein
VEGEEQVSLNSDLIDDDEPNFSARLHNETIAQLQPPQAAPQPPQAQEPSEGTVEEDIGFPNVLNTATEEEKRHQRQLQAVTVRADLESKRIITCFILALFAIWIVTSLIYILVSNGNVQVLNAGAAVLSGPLGIVIGYYFAKGEEKEKSGKG